MTCALMLFIFSFFNSTVVFLIKHRICENSLITPIQRNINDIIYPISLFIKFLIYITTILLVCKVEKLTENMKLNNSQNSQIN